ncbi:hypothetical protein IFM89_029140 [Coptis chinensis]|uniref:F-box domain-containing protein n=1 Tax=Coptis chinensis TaxID=261450 RepID=A0A835IMX2_9MAGN|nr:hypothetical protein IFM89_029140 [Coptis chinensis]
MGQSTSTPGIRSASKRSSIMNHQMMIKSMAVIAPEENFTLVNRDIISDLPDELLANIFHYLNSSDRNKCSLVCRRWFIIEGQSRTRLSLDARSDLVISIQYLFSRFDSVSKLALKCDRRSVSIGDEALTLISLRCRNLTRLKLRACRELTDAGMLAFAKNCKGLKKLSCGSCTFGVKGMNAILDHCSLLEELSVKRLRGLTDGSRAEPVGPGVAALSLKVICLKELYNGQCFGPLIAGAKNLRSLKLFRCSGDWDVLLESISGRVRGLVEVHLERLQVSDRGLEAISSCLDLEILHLVKTPECTNAGIVSIADRCKVLRKVHIDGWKTNRIGDEGFIAIARQCPKLQELVLIGVSPTKLSLGLLGNCRNLERLALCSSETIGDSEISCIAAKCVALKKLCIKGCPITNHAMEALVRGMQSLAVNLDVGASENLDASTSDGGPAEIGAETPQGVNQIAGSADIASGSNGRSSLSKARLGIFAGRKFAACTFRRWSNGNDSDGT